MKLRYLAFLVLAALTFSGCSYKVGKEITAQQMEQVVVNKSTKSDVEKAMGFPDNKAMLGETEIWTYEYAKTSSYGVYVKNDYISSVFEFDKNGVLIKKYQKDMNGRYF